MGDQLLCLCSNFIFIILLFFLSNLITSKSFEMSETELMKKAVPVWAESGGKEKIDMTSHVPALILRNYRSGSCNTSLYEYGERLQLILRTKRICQQLNNILRNPTRNNPII